MSEHPKDVAIYERDMEIHHLLGVIEDVRRIAEHTGRETGPGTGECDGDECIACLVSENVYDEAAG